MQPHLAAAGATKEAANAAVNAEAATGEVEARAAVIVGADKVAAVVVRVHQAQPGDADGVGQ